MRSERILRFPAATASSQGTSPRTRAAPLLQICLQTGPLPDFVFRPPQHPKGGKHKETTDVFAHFDDVALAIEVKAQAPYARKLRKIATGRSATWRKAVSKVKGAMRSTKGGSDRPSRERPPRRRPVLRPTCSGAYGLVVMSHTSGPFDARSSSWISRKWAIPCTFFRSADFYNLRARSRVVGGRGPHAAAGRPALGVREWKAPARGGGRRGESGGAGGCEANGRRATRRERRRR